MPVLSSRNSTAATSAHTLMVREIDYEHVELARARHGAFFKEGEGFGLNYLPFNAVAVVEALRDYPHLNASVGDDELVVHPDVNLGIAVDIGNEGLVVPVIRSADQLDLKQLARAIRDVAERARTKRLGADELAAGTFTISNPARSALCSRVRSSTNPRWRSSRPTP
jgi:2-oxoglutarate dehydrogenase E2 component (dihydrolipoamide succinyltransferase)